MTRCLILLACSFFCLPALSQIAKPNFLSSLQNDTLQSSFQKFIRSDSLYKIKNPNDSLRALTSKPNYQLNRAEQKLDSLQHSLQGRLDSLTKLPRHDTLVRKMIARITTQSDSLKLKLAAIRNKLNAPHEIGKATSAIEAPVTQVQSKLYEKLSAFQQNGMSDLPSVPGLPALPSASLPEGESGNLNLPNGSLPNIKTGGIEIPQADLPAASIPEIEQPSIPSASKPEGIGNYSGKMGEITDQVKDYQKEIKDFDPGKLDEIKNTDQWEDKLSELDEVEEIKKQIDLADQAKRYYDPEVAKEAVLNKAKQEAINHFAGHEEELKAAMEQLSKLKAKMPDTEGVIDLFAKRKNPMKDKAFIERLVPGLALQFQNQGSFWLDLNPTLAYKISGRFVAGLGWNERLAYDFDKTGWDSKNHIYGLRSFIHFKVKENFWLKGEMEAMRSPLRAAPLRGSDVIGRGWVVSYFGGIKKDFHLSKTLKGNVQMVYNLYNPEKKSPYVNRLNVRMGLELPLTKKPSDATNDEYKLP